MELPQNTLNNPEIAEQHTYHNIRLTQIVGDEKIIRKRKLGETEENSTSAIAPAGTPITLASSPSTAPYHNIRLTQVVGDEKIIRKKRKISETEEISTSATPAGTLQL